MFRSLLKSKIHRAVVTEANLNYIGSITIDEDLLDAADILEHEKVTIVNVTNGERFDTYVIAGPRGSGVMCLNGAAARRVHVGDIIIIITYCILDEKECQEHRPTVVFVDYDNKIQEISK